MDDSSRATVIPSASSKWLEPLVVCLGGVLLFASLYSELPIDDTDRFVDDVAAGIYQWDATHLFMQPAAVVWHRLFAFGGSSLASLKHVNTFCAALALAQLIILLRALGLRLPTRLLLVATGAVSFNVLNLATSGHIKLTVLPFLTLALHHAVLWEHELEESNRPSHRLFIAAIALGLATLFLINSGVVVPLLGVAILIAATRRMSFASGVAEALRFGALAAGLVLLVMGTTYAALATEPVGVSGFADFVTGDKTARSDFSLPVAIESAAKVGFGTLLNFVHTDSMGPVLRMRMKGVVPSLSPHMGALLGDFVASGCLLLILAWVYVRALLFALRPRAGVLTAGAFLLGTLVFAFYWRLSEAEFFFQITFPTLVLAGLVVQRRWERVLLGVWFVLGLTTNVIGWAIPKGAYPFARYTTELQDEFSADDLIVCFDMYPGKQCMGFFLPHLKDERALRLDRLHEELGNTTEYWNRIQSEIDDTLDANGRVVVFRILDEADWNAPWMKLHWDDVSKGRMRRFIESHWRVERIDERAGIPCWELFAR